MTRRSRHPCHSGLATGGGARQAAGFTLVELVVIASVLVILMLIGLPALHFQLAKSRLTGSCEQVSLHLLRARFESLKQGMPVVVRFGLDTRKLSGFLDENDDGIQSAGETLLFSVDVPEAGSQIAFYPMGPDGVEGTPDDAARAIVGFTDVDGDRVAIFRADGSIDAPGAIRFADGKQPRPNVFEVRVAPRSTARIEIRKFIHEDLNGFDSELGGSWFPRGGGKWKWY